MVEKNGTALYLFCFARPGLVREIKGTGVDAQHPLSVFRNSPDICAVWSEVALEDFCGPAAELHMQQLSWVGPRAFNHEVVIEEVMTHSPVLPVPFGTLFSSLEALEKFLDGHREVIAQFLNRVADQGEWSVKGRLDRKQARQSLMSASLAAQQERLAALPPGTRYFAEQRIQNDMERGLRRWLNQTCDKVAADLRSQASDFRECESLSPEAKEDGSEEVSNWAFLLPKSAAPVFRESIGRANSEHGPQGLLFELSGPWPPYRFVPPLSMETTS